MYTSSTSATAAEVATAATACATAAAPYDGIHHLQVYTSAGADLHPGAPLLHSVFHTHKHLAWPAGSPPLLPPHHSRLPAMARTDPKGEAATASQHETTAQNEREQAEEEAAAVSKAGLVTVGLCRTLQDELAEVEVRLEKYRARQAQWATISPPSPPACVDDDDDGAHARPYSAPAASHARGGSAASAAKLDALIEARVWRKREAEQDRALRRISAIVADLGPKLEENLRALHEEVSRPSPEHSSERRQSTALNDVNEEKGGGGEKTDTTERADGLGEESGPLSSVPAPTQPDGVQRAGESTGYLLLQRGSEHDARLQAAWEAELQRIRHSHHAAQVEAVVRSKRNEREALVRQHTLFINELHHEEQQTRRALLAARLWEGMLAGLCEDERYVRDHVEGAEAKARERLVTSCRREDAPCAASPTPTAS